MWNKIGKALGYPETVCDLLTELVKWLLGISFFLSVVMGILLPYLVLLGAVQPRLHQDTSIGLLVSALFVISFIFKFGLHCFLYEVTYWYPRLLKKLPSCPKINWKR